MIKHTSGTAPGFAAHSPSNQRHGFTGNRRLETTEELTTTAKDQPSFEVTLSKEAQDSLAADTLDGDTADAGTSSQGDEPVVSFGPGRSGQSPAHLARQYWTPDSGVPFGQYVSQIAKDRDWVPPELRAEEPAPDAPIVDDAAATDPTVDDPDAIAGIVENDGEANDGVEGSTDEGAVAGTTTADEGAPATVPTDDDGAAAAAILEAALEETPTGADEPTLVEELLEEEDETSDT